MIIFLPSALLIGSAIMILIIQQVRKSFGYTWLLAVGITIVTWILTIFLHFQSLTPVVIEGWLPTHDIGGTFIFQLDQVSWPYAFALISAALAVVLTASARLQSRSNPWTWAANLGMTGIGVIGVIAGSPLALILSWTAIDLIELIFLVGTITEADVNRRVVIAFSVRVIGSLLIAMAMIISIDRGQDLNLNNPLPDVSLILLLAAGLRLGVLPLHIEYSREIPMRRGIGNTLRMVAPASAMVVLARLPSTSVPPQLAPYLLLFSSLAAFYGAIMWLLAENEIEGRPYWLICLAGIAVSSTIRSYPEASLAWGTAMIFSGSLLFLFSVRDRKLLFLPLLGALGVSGLPFTPASSGWAGLVILPFNLPDIFFLLAHAVLLAGYLRHSIASGEPLEPLERWIQFFYPVGLGVLVVSGWFVGIKGWAGSLTLGVWWGSALSTFLALGGMYLYSRIPFQRVQLKSGPHWLVVVFRQVGGRLSSLFRLDWVYQFFNWVFRLTQRLVLFLTEILEGQGGVLWILVLLALLISLVKARNAQ